MEFTKMHSAGNDYIFIDCTQQFPDNHSELAIKLSDRHFGVGADGLICIYPSETADFRMRMFNADGSEGEMCGNGIRCAAKFVYDLGLVTRKHILFETEVGLRTVTLYGNNENIYSATADMGNPVIGKNIKITVKGTAYTGTAVSIGNPHFVITVPEPGILDLSKIGPEIEHYQSFENGTNTEFVKVLCRGRIQMRVWERGSGETLACGTGACAAVAALSARGETDSDVSVCVPGGVLDVSWKNHLFLTGPVVTVFEGRI